MVVIDCNEVSQGAVEIEEAEKDDDEGLFVPW